MGKSLSLGLRSMLFKGTLFMGAAILALSGVTSCSADDELKAPADTDSELQEKGVAMHVITDSDYLNGYVTNHNLTASRAEPDIAVIDADFAMPPLPAGYDEMEAFVPSAFNPNLAGNYYVAAGETVNYPNSLSFNHENIRCYVAGEVIVDELSVAKGKLYILPGGKVTVKKITSWGTSLSLSTDGSIYVYTGGLLSAPKLAMGANSTLCCEGSLTWDGEIFAANKLYVGGTLTVNGKLTLEKADVKAGAINANHTLVANDNSTINCAGRLLVGGSDTMSYYPYSAYTLMTNNLTLNADDVVVETPDGDGNVALANTDRITVNKSIYVDGNLTVSTSSILKTRCLVATGNLVFSNSESCEELSYVKGKTITIYTQAKFCLVGDALIDAGSYLDIKNTGFAFKFDNSAATSGVIKAETIRCEDSSGVLQMTACTGFFDLQYTYILPKDYSDYKGINAPYATITHNAGVTVAGNGGCKPGTAVAPPIEVLSDILVPATWDHTHPISATCIDVDGDNLYVSWHERGGNIHGCIEWLTFDKASDKASFKAWLETPLWKYGTSTGVDNAKNAYDFNHIIYSNGHLLTVGDHANKGGFLGQIRIADIQGVGDGYYGEKNIMLTRQLYYPHSGNAVVDDNGTLYIAGAGGFQTFDWSNPADFMNVKMNQQLSLPTQGSAKHVAVNDQYAVAICYTEPQQSVDSDPSWNDTWTAHPAEITVWSRGSFISASPVWSITVPAFAPQYGKDVIAIDSDNTIYSCQGHNGLNVYDLNNASSIASFNVADWYAANADKLGDITSEQHKALSGTPSANGVAVCSGYVFVAYGAAGLWILNKSDMQPVAYYIDTNTWESEELGGASAGASCNYVKVNGDGYVYVAYGLGRVKVLKFDASKAKSL